MLTNNTHASRIRKMMTIVVHEKLTDKLTDAAEEKSGRYRHGKVEKINNSIGLKEKRRKPVIEKCKVEKKQVK